MVASLLSKPYPYADDESCRRCGGKICPLAGLYHLGRAVLRAGRCGNQYCDEHFWVHDGRPERYRQVLGGAWKALL